MKAAFKNFQLLADSELYEAMVAKYGVQSYGDKLAIKTNNSFASWMIAEKVGDKYKITPISSQNNERQSLQMEAYWTVLKEFPIKEFSNVPQFYKQWFVNRGLVAENKMNEATDIKIGDAYKKNDRIEIIIRRFRGEKWDTIEWDTKWNEIMAAGTSPEHLINGKKVELPKALRKKIAIAASKEMKNPNNFLDNVGGLDAIKFALKEEADRDYKDEYKKFQSSEKSKKYRAELNKYNRDRGTYGNGDGKDATHKDGEIKGFEDESTNKGRREKSRLKKENIKMVITKSRLREIIIEEYQKLNEQKPKPGKVQITKASGKGAKELANLIKAALEKEPYAFSSSDSVISIATKEVPNGVNVVATGLVKSPSREIGNRVSSAIQFGFKGQKGSSWNTKPYRSGVLDMTVKLNEASSDKQDKTFIVDQLANAWEHMSPQEMFKHLAKQTKVDKNKLKKLVSDYYKNDKRRNADVMGIDLPKWVGEYI